VGENWTTHWYYGTPDLPRVLSYLQGCGPAHNALKCAIQQYWESLSASPDGMVVPQKSPSSVCALEMDGSEMIKKNMDAQTDDKSHMQQPEMQNIQGIKFMDAQTDDKSLVQQPEMQGIQRINIVDSQTDDKSLVQQSEMQSTQRVKNMDAEVDDKSPCQQPEMQSIQRIKNGDAVADDKVQQQPEMQSMPRIRHMDAQIDDKSSGQQLEMQSILKRDALERFRKVWALQGPTGTYINQYALGDAVASAAATLAAWGTGASPAWVPCKRARGTNANEQVKAFTQTLQSFVWPTFKKRHSEKCGWCVSCCNKRGCLLVQTEAQLVRFVDHLKPIEVQNNRPRHLVLVVAYLLYLEANLHGLLVGGPWEVAAERRRWRTSLEQACSVSAVKTALLQVLSRQPLFLFEINVCIGQGTEGCTRPLRSQTEFLACL
jgi:hypothetical protein